MADDAIGIAELSTTGTPSATTFLRGDNTWSTPAGSGGGTVASVVAGNNIDVDATDPANPIVSVETLTATDISDSSSTGRAVVTAADAAAGRTAIGAQASLGFTPENAANKNQANGYASLDGSGLVPAAQLPSYVDDVLEFANTAAFPGTGTTGKIYVALDTGKITAGLVRPTSRSARRRARQTRSPRARPISTTPTPGLTLGSWPVSQVRLTRPRRSRRAPA